MSILGVDVSTWQHDGDAPIDWEKVRAAGYRFAIIKATQGTSWTNPWFERDYDEATWAGMLVGAYHYYDTSGDAAAQAAHFVGTLIGRHLPVGAWLDYELPVANGYTASADVGGFLQVAADGRPGCGLYTNGYLHGLLKEVNAALPRLWIADPGAEAPPEGATCWQKSWTGQVPGVEGEVDIDEWLNVRGLNLDTAPKTRPAAAEVTPPQVAADAAQEAQDGPGDQEKGEGSSEATNALQGA